LATYRTRKRENPFVQIDKTMINDPEISWKAKGILSYLLSKPDDWITYISDLEKRAKDGRDSVRAGISELIEVGYIEKKVARDENGRFKGYEYIVHEIRSEEVRTENGKSDVGESDIGKTDIGKSNTTNNECTNNDSTDNEVRNEEEGDTSPDPILDLLIKNEIVHPNGINYTMQQDIQDVIDNFGFQVPEVMIQEAVRDAARGNGHTWKFVYNKLDRWRKHGYKTVQDVEDAKERYYGKSKGRNEQQGFSGSDGKSPANGKPESNIKKKW